MRRYVVSTFVCTLLLFAAPGRNQELPSTAPQRLGGLLPSGTAVAHKTGTIGGEANDVGYITLPDGRSFALAIFTRGSDTPSADRERAISEVTRTLYDYFLLKHTPRPGGRLR